MFTYVLECRRHVLYCLENWVDIVSVVVKTNRTMLGSLELRDTPREEL